jgi:aspartyl-tRNA(Asn)/glutamyl-tRNA(Gln) amidotransferase subunit C
VPMSNVLRADEPRPSLSPEEALANAPDQDRNHFRVPRVIE